MRLKGLGMQPIPMMSSGDVHTRLWESTVSARERNLLRQVLPPVLALLLLLAVVRVFDVRDVNGPRQLPEPSRTVAP